MPFKGPHLASCIAFRTTEEQHPHLWSSWHEGIRAASSTKSTKIDCTFVENTLVTIVQKIWKGCAPLSPLYDPLIYIRKAHPSIVLRMSNYMLIDYHEYEQDCYRGSLFLKEMLMNLTRKTHTFWNVQSLSWAVQRLNTMPYTTSTLQWETVLEIPQSSLQCPTAQSHPSSEKTRVFAKTENQGRTKKSWNFLTQMIKLKNSMSRSICKKIPVMHLKFAYFFF